MDNVRLNEENLKERQLGYIEKVKQIVNSLVEKKGRNLTCAVVNFGCQMNARDAEKLLGILLACGFENTDSEEADFVIYNTCTVRDNANQKVYGRLGRLKSMKQKNPDKRIALCGCMMQEAVAIEKVKTSYPFVDLIFGTHNLFCFAELLYAMYSSDKMVVEVIDKTDLVLEDLPISRKYSYKSGVNIMFGCNNFCTYCIVPYVRGRERSREVADIVREIQNLVADGVCEVMLLGQNVNSYGKNLESKPSFSDLLKEVEKIDGLKRIRFMTSHPKDLSDELIETMKHSTKICRHLHLPLQSGSSRILEAMNRHYDKDKYLSLVDKLRCALPDLSITTDIIVGFPGETKEDVDETIDVIKKAKFDNAFTFIYSKRTGTPAASMPQVDETFVKEQFDRVLACVQETAREQVGKHTGLVMEALIEEVNEQDATLITGRLSNNILVHVPGSAERIGSLVKVRLDACHGFYYTGEIVD